MTLTHEKRAAPVRTAPLAERNDRQVINPVKSNTTRNSWSSRYSVTFEGGTLWVLLFGQASLAIIASIAIVGGDGG